MQKNGLLVARLFAVKFPNAIFGGALELRSKSFGEVVVWYG
ncbi:hypothetical protein [Helicobacter suis]|nr:hypothetical protein [Helicobacter suis]